MNGNQIEAFPNPKYHHNIDSNLDSVLHAPCSALRVLHFVYFALCVVIQMIWASSWTCMPFPNNKIILHRTQNLPISNNDDDDYTVNDDAVFRREKKSNEIWRELIFHWRFPFRVSVPMESFFPLFYNISINRTYNKVCTRVFHCATVFIRSLMFCFVRCRSRENGMVLRIKSMTEKMVR